MFSNVLFEWYYFCVFLFHNLKEWPLGHFEKETFCNLHTFCEVDILRLKHLKMVKENIMRNTYPRIKYPQTDRDVNNSLFLIYFMDFSILICLSSFLYVISSSTLLLKKKKIVFKKCRNLMPGSNKHKTIRFAYGWLLLTFNV